VFALCFLLVAICFAPQPLRRPVPRLLICAVVLAAAFSAVGYAVYYVPYDWCSADQSNWYAWFQCLVS
jgi:multisubunit Na+/H+ antiporter MnhB subunit